MRLEELADEYLAVPTLSIIRCLVEVDVETEHVAATEHPNETAGRLAKERLDSLAAEYQNN